jgi:hypothetical protein
MTYSEKLSNPRWQRKRLEIMDRDNWSCTKCCSSTRTLHVHHKKYIKGANPWDYEDHFLTTLCYICHENEHEEIIDPERKYEHLILLRETPHVINSLNIQLGELQNKLKEEISPELTEEILKNIMFIQQQKKILR